MSLRCIAPRTHARVVTDGTREAFVSYSASPLLDGMGAVAPTHYFEVLRRESKLHEFEHVFL